MSSIKIAKRVLTVTEREGMKHDINMTKRDLSKESPELSREAKKHLYYREDFDPSVDLKNLKMKEALLARGSPQPLTKDETATLEREAKVLEENIRKMMLGKSAIYAKPMENGHKNEKVITNATEVARVEHSQKYLQMAHQLKNIRRTLRPDDSNAGNLEYLRPD